MNVLNPSLGVARPGPQDSMTAVRTSNTEENSLVRQYLRIAYRWRWLISGVAVAVVVLGLIATFLMTPQYSATATIEISRETDKVTDFQGVERESSAADQEFYQTQYGLLRARSLAERVATELKLVDDPAFFAMFDAADPDDPAFELTNGRYPASGRAKRLRDAAQVLLDHLAIAPTRLSRLVDISFLSPDPAFSARVANAWAEKFITTNLERKVEATSYGREQLQRQLAEYKKRLDESQRQLVAYASNNEIINLPVESAGSDGTTSERSIVADNLASLNTALASATADRIAAEARARQQGRSGSSTEALANPAINNLRSRRAELAAQYQELMVRFEPGYPAAKAIKSQIDQLDAAIAREEGRVSGSIQADYRTALSREQSLQSQVDRLKGAFLDERRRSIQYNIFQQEVDTNRTLYDGLLQRFKEIGVAGGVGLNNVAIVDTADVPERPSSPRLLMNLLFSLLVGLGLGASLALILNQMDETIADPDEMERKLGFPLLGAVPRVDEDLRDALLDRKSELFDAYLAIQTNLAFTTEHGVPRSFAVTSTRPSEGKSTTALALATTLARAQRKVILVDGDMRSPSVHQLIGITHDRGLSNYLAGDDDVAHMTVVMPDLGFTAMSAGPIPPNAAELLTGARLEELLRTLAKTFDHVIIDSPPVMGLADAPLIASRVEGLVYVVESHGIRSKLVKAALTRLAAANARIFGTVLSKFEARKANYGYGYEYGYNYGREATREAT